MELALETNFTLETVKCQYLKLLNEGADLTKLCTQTAHYIGNPVALSIHTKTILAMSPDYSEDLLEENMLFRKHSSDQEITALDKTFNEDFVTGKARVYLWPYCRHKQINCGCVFNNTIIAVLIVPIVNEMPDQLRMDVCEIAAQVFVTALQLNGYFQKNEYKPMQQFLNGLLNGTISRDYQMMFFRGSDNETINRFRVIWLEGVNRKDQLKSKVMDFCASRKNWWCVSYFEGYVILLDAAYADAVGQLQSAVRGHLRICASDEFSDLNETKTQVNLARLALHYASLDDNSEDIVYVDEYKAHLAYAYAYVNSGMDIFQNNTVEAIDQYDNAHNTKYLETLKAYLRFNQDCGKMAKNLYLHKNTIVYRMKRLNELFNVDFTDCRQLVNLYLSLWIKEHDYDLSEIK